MCMDNMQMMILAGGLGTRMRPITEQIAKSMIEIKSKPFLWYQLDLLKRQKINNIVFCVGYLSDQIENYFKDGSDMGVNIIYSKEEKPLGTAGAIKNAEPLLNDEFLVMNGDSYLMIDYLEFVRHFKERNKLAQMLVYRNNNCYENSNVIVNDGLVKLYSRKIRNPEMVYVDAGLFMFKKDVLKLISQNCNVLLDEIFEKLVDQNQLLAYEVSQRFYEVGSKRGLEEFEKMLEEKL